MITSNKLGEVANNEQSIKYQILLLKLSSPSYINLSLATGCGTYLANAKGI